MAAARRASRRRLWIAGYAGAAQAVAALARKTQGLIPALRKLVAGPPIRYQIVTLAW